MKNKRQWKMKYRPRFPKGDVFKQLLIMGRCVYFGFSYSGNARFRQYVRARNKLSGHYREGGQEHLGEDSRHEAQDIEKAEG